MDAFLRRVVEQRELEQEHAILSRPPEVLDRHCRLCGKRVREHEHPSVERCSVDVCTACGGIKVARRLEAEDQAAARARRRRDELLALAGIPISPTPGAMMADEKLCPHCGKKLRADNTRGACSACLAKGADKRAADGGGQDAAESTGSKKARAKADVVKRFKTVATALGVDPDALIAEFCEGWLERVRSSANFGNSSSDS